VGTTKGSESKERIVERAFRLASRDGLEGLSLGALATDLGVSKSGLFAHFKSKEELEVAVLAHATDRFEAEVVRPALKAQRGLPRLKRLFEGWLAWLRDPGSPGGCIFVAAAIELDDRDGRPRELLVEKQRQLDALVANLVLGAVTEGHLRTDVDAAQLVFDLRGIILATSYTMRLYRDRGAIDRARAAFERLIAQSAPR
jgi:AcrR family transcriptional regulator